MTQDPDKSFTDVAALMKERQKLEAWLEALEARRGSTPERVFERVRADYEARLDRVMSDLLTHRDALEARVRELDGRLQELEVSEQQRREQRAEMELRAMVGELGEDDFAQTAREVDEAIARAMAEKGDLRSALDEANELLRAATTPRPMTPIPAAAAVPAAKPAAQPAPAAAQRESVAEPRLTAARHAPPQPQPSAPRPAARPSAPVRANEVAAAERAAANGGSAPAAPNGEPPRVQVAPAAEPPPVAAQPGDDDGRIRPASTFDELAFLNSIVGEEEKRAQAAAPAAQAPAAPAPAPAPQSAPAPRAAPLDDLGLMRDDMTGADSIRASRATGVPSDVSGGIVQEENVGASLVGRVDEPPDPGMPLSENVTGNHPIVLRPAGDVAQHKTLRCNECGAMNYPTEWYCERCGAELAAL